MPIENGRHTLAHTHTQPLAAEVERGRGTTETTLQNGVHLQFKAVRLSYNPLIPTPATRRCSPLLASLFAVAMRLNCFFFLFHSSSFSLLNERTMRPEQSISRRWKRSLPSVYRLSFRLHRRNFHIVLVANAHMRAREPPSLPPPIAHFTYVLRLATTTTTTTTTYYVCVSPCK